LNLLLLLHLLLTYLLLLLLDEHGSTLHDTISSLVLLLHHIWGHACHLLSDGAISRLRGISRHDFTG
jgi:hypothetical protein